MTIHGEHTICTGFRQEDIQELIKAGEHFLCDDFTAFQGTELRNLSNRR